MNSAYPGVMNPPNLEADKHSTEASESFIWIEPGRQEMFGTSTWTQAIIHVLRYVHVTFPLDPDSRKLVRSASWLYTEEAWFQGFSQTHQL